MTLIDEANEIRSEVEALRKGPGRKYSKALRERVLSWLKRADDEPWPGAYLQPVPRLNPGGGLVSSLGDYTRLVSALLAGGRGILRPESLPFVFDNQLPEGVWAGLPPVGPIEGRGHSYAGSVGVHPSPRDPSRVVGELQWGGMAGTKWWISPRDNLAAALRRIGRLDLADSDRQAILRDNARRVFKLS